MKISRTLVRFRLTREAASLLLGACLSTFVAAQSQSTLPEGVSFPVALTADLDIRGLKTVDTIKLRVTNNLRTKAGALVIPRDATALARVKAHQLAKNGQEAQLYLVVENVTWRGGVLPLRAYIIPPLRMPRVLKIDLKHADPMFRPDLPLVGIRAHDVEGTYLYCRRNFVLQEGTTFWVEQMSKPGPSAPPAIK